MMKPEEQDNIQALRSLILSREQAEIKELRERLDDPQKRAEEVARVLSESITIRAAGDDSLSRSLASTIDESLHISVQKNPKKLVDAIFPVIAPAIRKTITTAIRGMVESLNRLLEQGLSIKSLRWRWEAYKTGKKYSEVVLLHTLLYRVEQVFLIHRQSGILLQHVSASAVETCDSDMVSGMLTAIQDFTQDSFQVEDDETIDTLELGDLAVQVVAGPHAILAAVIRGTPGSDVRGRLQEQLEAIHLEQHAAWDPFEGNTALFERSRPRLEDCLLEAGRLEEKKKRVSPGVWAVGAVVILAVVLLIFHDLPNNLRWNGYVERLQSEPGIVVLSETKEGDTFCIEGLADPLAENPQQLLAGIDLPAERVKASWGTYYSLAPDFMMQRFQKWLLPPESVQLAWQDNTVLLKGSATYAWHLGARKKMLLLPAVTDVDDTALEITDKPLPLLERASKILHPPSTVTVGFTDGLLSLSGTATQAWARQARRNAFSIPEVESLDTSQLTTLDSTEAQLALANRCLNPPEAVSLRMDSGALTASGTASYSWLTSAKRLVALMPGVETFSHDALQVTHRPGDALKKIEEILAPPDLVDLRLSNGILHVQGKAPYDWILEARKVIPLIPEVDYWQTDQLEVIGAPRPLLERAIALLDPAATTEIRVQDRQLVLAGTCTPHWMDQTRRLITLLPDIDSIVDRDLTVRADRDAALQLARQILTPPETVVLEWHNGALAFSGSASEDWFQSARRLALLMPGISGVESEKLEIVDRDTVLLHRITAALAPPASVTLAVEQGTLILSGEASDKWIRASRRKLGAMSEVRWIDDQRLVNRTDARFKQFKQALERQRFHFVSGKSELVRGKEDAIAEFVFLLRELLAHAESNDISIQVVVYGHVAESVFGMSKAMSEDRAEAFKRMLVDKGIASHHVAAIGMGINPRRGITFSDEVDQRCVTFGVFYQLP